MKAAIFYGPNQPLKIEETPTPSIKPNEVLVKVAACGVCHTDLHYIDHGTPTFKKPPLILGHEASGTLAQIGGEVKNFKEGDKVLLPAVYSCGYCEFCRTGRENICQTMVMFGNNVDGAYAEYIVAPGKDIFHLPKEIPLEEGAIIADATSTPFHAVKNRAEVKAGDTVVVFGCGGVGVNVVQIAAAVGGVVIAVDISDKKLEWAKKFGAAYTLNPTKVENLGKEVKKLTGGGADIAIEAIGKSQTIEAAFGTLRKGGRLVVIGYSSEDIKLSAAKIMYFEMEIRGSLGCRPVDYPKLIELCRLGKVKVAELVTHKFPLEKINDAFNLLRAHDDNALRSIVLP
ncbi:MAG: zinc-binding dehydrogenase [Bacteroidota bacterium]